MRMSKYSRILPVLTGLGFVAFGVSMIWEGCFNHSSLTYPFSRDEWIAVAVGVVCCVFGVMIMRLSPRQVFRLSFMDLTALLDQTSSKDREKTDSKDQDWTKRLTNGDSRQE